MTIRKNNLLMNTDIQKIIVRILKNNVSEKEMQFFFEWFRASEENKTLFFQVKDIYA